MLYELMSFKRYVYNYTYVRRWHTYTCESWQYKIQIRCDANIKEDQFDMILEN